MAQLAIFIDGAYAAKIAAQNLRIWIDYERLSNAIRDMIAGSTQEPLDLLRTYFYDCLPYQSDPPTPEEADRFGKKRRFFSGLQRLPKYKVRQGRLRPRGIRDDGTPIFQQKRVDLMIGLDIASLRSAGLPMQPSLRETATFYPHSSWLSRRESSFGWCMARRVRTRRSCGSWLTIGSPLTTTIS